MEKSTDSDQASRIANVVQVLYEHYAEYHNHKESVSYTGFALFVGAAGAILTSDDWPPKAWGDHTTLISVFALSGFWVLVLLYLRFQLRRRRWAALRLAGCERVLVKLATGNYEEPTDFLPACREKCPEVPVHHRIADVFWPSSLSVKAMEIEKKKKETKIEKEKERPLYPRPLRASRETAFGSGSHEGLCIRTRKAAFIHR